MAISFSFKNNAQYVKLEGKISAVEEAAVRLKLDQKITQGRDKILIDVSGFATDDKDSVYGLHSVLKFALQRGTALGLFGLKQTSWLSIAENFPVRLNLFETEGEALKWIETAEAKKTNTNAPEKKPDPEAEIKEKKLKELLAKYKIYQAKNDYDPYLLKKFEQEYQKAPFREALFALRRAHKNVYALKETIEQLDLRCRQLADQLLESTIIRKIPLSPAELSVKQKAIQDVRAVVEGEVNEVKSQIDEKMATAVDYRKRMQALEEKWKQELQNLQQQIDSQKAENSKVLSQLQAASS